MAAGKPAHGPAGEGPDDRAEEIVEHLFALVDRLRARFEESVAAFQLSPVQAKALRYVADTGPVPMNELARRLGCDASNVTGIVDRLEHRGLLERCARGGDRRVKTLVVTGPGAAVAEAMWAEVLSGATSSLSLSGDERLQLLILLRRLD